MATNNPQTRCDVPLFSGPFSAERNIPFLDPQQFQSPLGAIVFVGHVILLGQVLELLIQTERGGCLASVLLVGIKHQNTSHNNLVYLLITDPLFQRGEPWAPLKA